MKNMNGKISVILVALFLMMPTMAKSQIYLSTEDEEFNSDRDGTQVWYDGGIPFQASDLDQTYVPLGNGLWLLAGFGSFYLLRKCRKEEE